MSETLTTAPVRPAHHAPTDSPADLDADTPPESIDAAAAAAGHARGAWGASTGAARAALLTALAEALEAERAELVALADQETHLGAVRLHGELDRTAYQLCRFAALAEAGAPFAQTHDPAVSGAPPVGHPDLLRIRMPVGPVAMFAASNFPFAFSVLGGDTASALAAGCPVVVKAHGGHPALSARVHRLAQRVLAERNLPAGLIGMVQGHGHAVGARLIAHPAIEAGAFTGSTRGGAALQAVAQQRPRPIPFYGELGSVNPVVLLPNVLAGDAYPLAQMLAASITLGCGQFCTSPGILVVPHGEPGDRFVQALRDALAGVATHPMLTPGMRQAWSAGVAHWMASGAQPLLPWPQADGTGGPAPFLAQVEQAAFLARAELREEVFGPAALVVRVQEPDDTLAVLEAVGGSLTVTLWGAQEPSEAVQALVRGAMQMAGRVLFAGVPTGVAVSPAQQHGGPWPASTQPLTTSVGDAAMDRFLRPVALQDAPAWLRERAGRPC